MKNSKEIYENNEYMAEVVFEYIDLDCCDYDSCVNCSELEVCYNKAQQICNHEYAESIDFGGYETEEEFWEDLFD